MIVIVWNGFNIFTWKLHHHIWLGTLTSFSIDGNFYKHVTLSNNKNARTNF
jgi:hypothetical protein